jgi:hypothetical protein
MLLSGDELGRTQRGNNNVYCQDNEISWVDWSDVDEVLLEFTRGSSSCVAPIRCSAAAAGSREPSPRSRRRRHRLVPPRRHRDVRGGLAGGLRQVHRCVPQRSGIAARAHGRAHRRRFVLRAVQRAPRPAELHPARPEWGERWVRVLDTSEGTLSPTRRQWRAGERIRAERVRCSSCAGSTRCRPGARCTGAREVASPPRATYRLQLRPGFGFEDAAAVAGYLAELGVSHVYTSPYLQAAPGSAHGYDVVDHGRVNDELGGPEAHRRFVAALDEVGLGQVVDVVPNHMAIGPPQNRWWWDVLENGPSSRYADHFDVDWDPPGSRAAEPGAHADPRRPLRAGPRAGRAAPRVGHRRPVPAALLRPLPARRPSLPRRPAAPGGDSLRGWLPITSRSSATRWPVSRR